jgi:uncharacterized protein (DUF58 family)
MADPSLREILDPRRFFLGGKALPGPLTLTHRRVFILPNRRGLSLFCLLFIQLIASINYNNNLGFILTFLVGSIATLGTLYGFRNLAGLSLRPGQPNPVFAGDAARFTLTIDNPTQTPRIGIYAGFRHGLQQELNLAPGESMAVVLTFEASRRGWLELPTVTLSSVFPLGLFQVWSPVRFIQRALVYPRPSPDNIPFPSSPAGEGGRMQATEDDFHGFQRYQPGDSMRNIHWKGVAKGQSVQVKEYRGEESLQIYLDWLQTPGFDAEARLSRLCRWVLEAEKSGGTYGLRLPGTDIKPSSGQAHLRVCLERLALFGIPG